MSLPRVKWIAVEGAIGEGKSTLNELLRRAVQSYCPGVETVEIMPELVDEFKPLLIDFYKEPKHNAYPLQTEVFRLSVQQHRDRAAAFPVPTNTCLISERSFIGHKCFAAVQNERGNFTSNQYEAYLKWCDMWTEMLPYQLAGVVYLRTPIDICMERIKVRGREGEDAITTQYMQSLQAEHDVHFLPPNIAPEQRYTETHTIQVGSAASAYTVPVLCIENTGPVGDKAALDSITRFIAQCIDTI